MTKATRVQFFLRTFAASHGLKKPKALKSRMLEEELDFVRLFIWWYILYHAVVYGLWVSKVIAHLRPHGDLILYKCKACFEGLLFL